jgi:hypothetical protein
MQYVILALPVVTENMASFLLSIVCTKKKVVEYDLESELFNSGHEHSGHCSKAHTRRYDGLHQPSHSVTTCYWVTHLDSQGQRGAAMCLARFQCLL